MSRSHLPAWEDFIAAHSAGDVVQGRVTKVVPFGAFVEIVDGVTGLLVSEEQPAAGSTVTARIKEIDADRQRFSLVVL